MNRSTEMVWSLLLGLMGGSLLALSACGGLNDESKLPPDVKDPASLHTPAGALARYRSALTTVPKALDLFAPMTGVLTDELADLPAPPNVGRSPYTAIDSRQDLTIGFENTYAALHAIRGQAREARGFITAYAPDSSTALAGHLYAIEGYAEVFLADLFCSGIPLSTVDFNGDYTLAAGSSTGDVYRHALMLFDSAFALTSDSMAFQYLASVGKGRALVALGRYAEAAAAVASVPDAYQYRVVRPTLDVTNTRLTPPLLQQFADGGVGDDATGYVKLAATPGAADREGLHGLDYRTSADPRTPATALPGTDPFGNTMYFPNKYPVSGATTYTVADGIEARLIEAEAALQAGDAVTWLAKLNALRTDGTSEERPTADPNDDPAATYTFWHKGSGGVDSLAPLTDPGTTNGRVDLLFRERAFWLYLTGHRQGDLRRLVREYLRAPDSVYPTGQYPGGLGVYGSAIVAPVPAVEQEQNTRYTGCLHTDA